MFKKLKYNKSNFNFYKLNDVINNEIHYNKYNSLIENDKINLENIEKLNNYFKNKKNKIINFKILKTFLENEIINIVDEILNLKNIFNDILNKEARCYISLYDFEIPKYGNDTSIVYIDKKTGEILGCLISGKFEKNCSNINLKNSLKIEVDDIINNNIIFNDEIDLCNDEKTFCEDEYEFC